jgi:hypothetical protein
MAVPLLAVPMVRVDRPGFRPFVRVKVPNALERGEHGTPACYGSGCRCRRCVAAARSSERARLAELRVLHGEEPCYHLSTVALAAHVAELRRRGWSLRRIGLAAGLNPETVGRALRVGRTDARTVARVLEVR